MNLTAEDEGGILVISVKETRIDAANCLQFKENFRQLVPDGRDRVVLNLDGVGFVDSSGLGAIVGVIKLLAPATKLDLSNMGETVQKVFTLTRMDQVFKIHERVADAVCAGQS